MDHSSNRVTLEVHVPLLAPYLPEDMRQSMCGGSAESGALERVVKARRDDDDEVGEDQEEVDEDVEDTKGGGGACYRYGRRRGILSSDGMCLRVSSHLHRSAYKNEQECHQRLLREITRMQEVALAAGRRTREREREEERRRVPLHHGKGEGVVVEEGGTHIAGHRVDPFFRLPAAAGERGRGKGAAHNNSSSGGSAVITRAKEKRRRKGSMRQMQRAARKGALW